MVAPREATLINIGMREWLLLGVQTLDEGINNTSTHTHRRETAIVIQILHRNLARKVREESQHIVGTIGCRSITQRRHLLAIIQQRFKTCTD